MGPQNIRNHYFKKVKARVSGDNHHDLELSQDELMSIDFKLSYDGYYDLYLASDEEDYNKQVLYSTSIIDSGDGNNLPVWVDINSSLSRDTTRVTTCADQIYYSAVPLTIISKNVWGGARSTCSTASTTFTICDIMWTGMDNGLWDGRTLGVPNCLTLKNNTNASSFDRFQYDKRFKLNQVRDLSYYSLNTDTSITLNADSSGYFYDLKGGFFQGFYKLYGYPYEVLPNRPNKGWSFETYLKIHSADTTTSYCYTVANNEDAHYCFGTASTTFNYNNGGTYPPNNGGFFFYKGIRAEDKWGFTGDTNMDQTILSACTTITGQTDCCDVDDEEVLLLGQNMSPSPKYDTFSNAIGFRITEDMRIGYRTIRYTKECVDTGEVLTGGTCATATTMQQESICGYIIEESYSEPICPYAMLSGTCADIWLQVDVVFERDLYIDECDLYNDGGVNDLIKVRHDKFYRYGQHFEDGDSWGSLCDCDDKQYPEFIDEAYFNYECKEPQVQKWFSERDFRMGTLKFYVNGRIVHTVNDYEEIIPRQLNTNKETQVGVAYNMSWGGGSQGLRNMLAPVGSTSFPLTDCSGTTLTGVESPWLANPMSANEKLISDNFGGSFVGGISQMMYYVKPLQADEIYHNFKINKERYSLIDCEECEDCPSGCIDCQLPSGTTQNITYTTYIPDNNFRAALEALGITFNSSNRTETFNLLSITELNITNLGIDDLTGIENFINLTELNVYYNQLTSLDLSNNTALTYLSCGYNDLTSLDVSNLSSLTDLYCLGNDLTSIDLSDNVSLTNLNLSFNDLTTLDVTNNPNLEELQIMFNPITSLDLTNNTSLTSFIAYGASLTNLDIANGNNTNMTVFVTLANPLLTTINVDDANWATTNWTNPSNIDTWTTFTDFYKVYVPDANFRTELINVHGVVFDTNNETLSTSVNTITTLDLQSKNITDLTGLSGVTGLQILRFHDNQVTAVDLSYNSNLTEIRCDDNQLTSLDISSNTNLQVLYCWSNQLTGIDVSQNTTLKELKINDNQLTSLDVSQNTALEWLECQNNQLTTIDVSNNTTLLSFNCGSNQLTSIDVTQNTMLATLIFQYNQLTTIDVSHNTIMTTLNCQGNQLTTLDLTTNSPLQWLRTSSNPLTVLDLSNQGILRNLYCENCGLTSLDLTNVVDIRNIHCFNNQIGSLDLSNNPLLKTIRGDNNSFTSLDFSNNPLMTLITVVDCNITNIDVSNSPMLDYFFCGENPITSLDVTNNPLLENFNCKDTNITTIDVTQNTQLKQLRIMDNTGLTSIDLTNNIYLEVFMSVGCDNISSIDLSQQSSLTKLWAYNSLNLTSLNVQNGNNINMELEVYNTPNLTCIKVDDPSWSTTNWTSPNNIDSQHYFSLSC